MRKCCLALNCSLMLWANETTADCGIVGAAEIRGLYEGDKQVSVLWPVI